MDERFVLYRDDHYIAVDKPPGFFVHRSEMNPAAPFILGKVRDVAGCHVWPVHRLDRPTSGIVVFATSGDAAGRLSKEFREKRVKKEYHAVVRGYVGEVGKIDYPLRKNNSDREQSAVTEWKRLARVEIEAPVGRYSTARFSLVAVYPETGRFHQIRRHFAHISHPIIGDTVHGDGKQNRFFRERFENRRLLLAATGLSFYHPYTGGMISVQAPLEPSMKDLVDQLFV